MRGMKASARKDVLNIMMGIWFLGEEGINLRKARDWFVACSKTSKNVALYCN